MQTQEINRIVQDLLQRGYEGTYWDYKEDYTDCKEDKLIDIICMANNIDGRDAYLIYGANDDGIVTGIENTTYTRYTTKSGSSAIIRKQDWNTSIKMIELF